MNNPILVLGVGRSGTSAVAQILHQLGIFMGEEFIEANCTNIYGHWEDKEFWKLTRNVIERKNDKYWKDELDNLVKKRISLHRKWGFKVPGASEILPFSIVAYSADSKEEFLGVPDYVIREFGTISLECAKVMAEGLVEYEVDFGLATTGVIGESIEDKLKGTAFIAVAVSGMKTFGKELVLDPKLTRRELKEEIVKNLFEVLLHAIESTY